MASLTSFAEEELREVQAGNMRRRGGELTCGQQQTAPGLLGEDNDARALARRRVKRRAFLQGSDRNDQAELSRRIQ
jgi:hypothetical protein